MPKSKTPKHSNGTSGNGKGQEPPVAHELHEEDGTPKKGHIHIGPQYVKDLSFESPGAPKSLMAAKQKPKIDLQVDTIARPVQANMYEVMLHIVAKASVENRPVFLCDLTYCGLFTLEHVPEKQIEPALLVQGANMLYPFARRIIADLTSDGGFPALKLEPIDFTQIYLARRQARPK